MIDVFKSLGQAGRFVIISSHILHEVDLISDQVILLNEGYVVAEGDIRGVRGDLDKHPLKILIRCTQPSLVASRMFDQDGAVEVHIHDDGRGLLVSTRDADRFFLILNRIVLENDIDVEAVTPADEDVQAVYRYLIGSEKDQI